MIVRLRTKDGTERLQVDSDAIRLADLQGLIAAHLQLPVGEQLISRDPGKKELFSPSDAGTSLKQLGVQHGTMLYLHYSVERELNPDENIEMQKKCAAEKHVDPLMGELRKQKQNWTLTDYVAFRATREFKLVKPPEPKASSVSMDTRASQNFLGYMQSLGFACKRVGILYGRFNVEKKENRTSTKFGNQNLVTVEEETLVNVQVDAIYEPPQECTDTEIRLLENAEEEETVKLVTNCLGLQRVGWIVGHPHRDYVFTVAELQLAAKMHSEAIKEDEEMGQYFVTLRARPITEDEDLEGVATIESYQLTEQCLELVEKGMMLSSKTAPSYAKVPKDHFFLESGKEVKKASTEYFISRVFDMSKPHQSMLSCSFPVENRLQMASNHELKQHLTSRRSQPFLLTVADFHLILFLTQLLDKKSDVPVLCQTVAEGKSEQLEGFKMMIECYAGLN